MSFTTLPPDVPELEHGPPHEIAVENAYRKAAAIADRAGDALVIGVDTIVCIGRQVYGKPQDEEAARATLRTLSGRRHTVISGISLIEGTKRRTAAASTVVAFRKLDEDVLDWYVDTGEWRERAGGYAIQGRGAALVERIEGDYPNVVGLPLALLLDLEPGLLTGR